MREYVEDTGGYTVIPEETPHRLLRPIMASTVERWARRSAPVEAGVDSSSRPLETSVGALAVGGAASAAPGLYPLAEWPSLHGLYGGGGPGFVAVIGVRARGSWPLVAESPAGYSYEEYSLEQALDEMRVSLENWLLSGPVLEWARRARRAGMAPVVLVDGPVVPVTMAFQGGARTVGDSRYREAWRRLVEERLDAIRRLERAGAAVVGVVKRLGKSTILSRLAGAVRGLERLARSGVGDQRMLYYLYQRETRWLPGRVYASPRLRVIITRDGEVAVEKIVEYLAVPPGKWSRSPGAARFYRVEYTEGSRKLLERLGARGVYPVVHDSVLRGSLEPVEIAASDRRARQITRSLRGLIAGLLVREGVPLEYRALMEAHA